MYRSYKCTHTVTKVKCVHGSVAFYRWLEYNAY